jgi:hypothetical protein
VLRSCSSLWNGKRGCQATFGVSYVFMDPLARFGGAFISPLALW